MTLAAHPTALDGDLPPEVPGFELGCFLGRGSSGAVWAARATGEVAGSARDVAIKLSPRDGAAVGGREVEVGSLVVSEHLVRTRERLMLADGTVALVLDLADGGSLQDVVSLRGSLPPGEVVTVLAPLASALAALHRSGVVHADVAPGNVLFTPSGKPMLADLTSARFIEDTDAYLPVGTPGFVAPEVLAGELPSPASDIWALGALIWYARTGGASPPGWVGWARGSGSRQSGRGGGQGDAVAQELEEITAAVGPELRPVLLRMLSSDPTARPTAGSAALAVYRSAPAVAVTLVGRHFDPAAAVTNRLRREAIETRSRTELRRVERQRTRQERRRRLLHPRILARRIRRHRISVAPRSRRAAVALGALGATGFVGSLGGLVWVTGIGQSSAPLTPASASVSALATAPATGEPSATLSRDPSEVMQRLADARASALTSRDATALLGSERDGSAASHDDAATIDRLTRGGQRYQSVAFAVRSARVTSASSDTAVVRAVIDRAACSITGADGSTQTMAAAPGQALDYRLTLVGGEWRIAEISAPSA